MLRARSRLRLFGVGWEGTPHGVAEFAQAFRAEFDRYGQMSQLTYVRYFISWPGGRTRTPEPAHELSSPLCVSPQSAHKPILLQHWLSIYAVLILIRDSDLSPIIDIHLPSPSIKKTHGRQTSYQGACIAKLSISRATRSIKSAGNTPLLRIQGGGRGWLCYFLMKRKVWSREDFRAFVVRELILTLVRSETSSVLSRDLSLPLLAQKSLFTL